MDYGIISCISYLHDITIYYTHSGFCFFVKIIYINDLSKYVDIYLHICHLKMISCFCLYMVMYNTFKITEK